VRFDLLNPTPQHLEVRNTVRAFAEREVAPQAYAHDRAESFNVELFRRLGELGLLGITVPERFGGSAMDATAAVIANEELAAADAGFTLAYLSHSILFAHNLARNGDDEQRRRFLPQVCAGRTIAGMAMSEASAGTDTLAMSTHARRDGDRYVLNGRKMWITNGTVGDGELGDVFLVYARTSASGPRGVSLFVVERGAPGFSLGQAIGGKLGMRASGTAELVFDDCEVPVDNRVGDEGKAVFHMMSTFEIERLTLAAMSLGIARRALEIMNAYASDRTAFGKPIRTFGQIQRHLGESYAELMAGRSYVYRIAHEMNAGDGPHTLDADGAKLFCSTMAKRVADRAVQVLGGYGYTGEYVVERLWRDAKLLEIGGGTIEAHQKNITQNLRRVRRIP
jgi:isovaleryl-CoA dehydrogenase